MRFEHDARTGGLELDLGCGSRKRPGSIGVDLAEHSDADVRFDLDADHWPISDSTVGHVNCSHVIEHVASIPHFLDEIHRGCVKQARIVIKTPHFSCWRSYSDPTHRWHLSLHSLEHFTAEAPSERLTRGRFRVIRAELSFDGFKRWLIAPIARRWPKTYERSTWRSCFPPAR